MGGLLNDDVERLRLARAEQHDALLSSSAVFISLTKTPNWASRLSIASVYSFFRNFTFEPHSSPSTSHGMCWPIGRRSSTNLRTAFCSTARARSCACGNVHRQGNSRAVGRQMGLSCSRQDRSVGADASNRTIDMGTAEKIAGPEASPVNITTRVT